MTTTKLGLILLTLCFAACDPVVRVVGDGTKPAADPVPPVTMPPVNHAFALSPQTVLTCETVSLRAQFPDDAGPAAAGVAWSIDGAGAVRGMGDDLFQAVYQAPVTQPNSMVVVGASTAQGFTFSAPLRVRTADPGVARPISEPLPADTGAVASGDWVYLPLVMRGDDGREALVVRRSTDAGRHWGPVAVVQEVSGVTCVAAAVDAGDPNILYVTYAAGDAQRLAVSRDGGRSFEAQTLGDAGAGCAAVTSPRTGHVMVAHAATSEGGVAVWSDGARVVLDDVATAAPRLFSNGWGDACLAYVTDRGLTVRCTTGARLGAPVVIAGPGVNGVTGTIAPTGRVTIGWQERGSLFIADSTNGGQRFSAATRVAAGESLDLRFDRSERLWLAWVAGGRAMIDKSCDGSTTFSGAMLAAADATAVTLVPADGAPRLVTAAASRELELVTLR